MRYKAFFSYARADDRVANWLHRGLDAYRTPKALIGEEGALGPVPSKLHPIFRDRTDLEAGGHVATALEEALNQSETLVVLCTPVSAKSVWVNQEVESFLRQGREAAIFPVIAAGEPDSGDPATECFPPALRNKGLLAADLREIRKPNGQLIGDGREGGCLKLIAGLLGVPLDKLIQRERKRQRRTMAGLGAAAILFGVVAVAAVGFGLLSQQQRADIARQVEEIAKANVAILAEKKTAEDRKREALFQKGVAEDNARETVRQSGIANDNAQRAENTLLRLFAARAWEAIDRGDLSLAARYALAGQRLSPANTEAFRSALGAALHRTPRTLPPMEHTRDLSGAVLSPDETRVATFGESGDVKIWNAVDARLVLARRAHEGGAADAAFFQMAHGC